MERFLRCFTQKYSVHNEQKLGFEKFMHEILPDILHENTKMSFESGGEDHVKCLHNIEFKRMRIDKPVLKTYTGKVNSVYPNDCRVRNLDYLNTVYIDINHTILYGNDTRSR